jgi:hypothetical protein
LTVPEEHRPKTTTTDDMHVLESRTKNGGEIGGENRGESREANAPRPPGATGRTMREAMEEARVRPEDFGEE